VIIFNRKTVYICDQLEKLVPSFTKELVPKVVSLNGAKSGVFIHEIEWSRKWREAGKVAKIWSCGSQ